MLQQPHGVPGCGKDQKGTGSHPHDGSHQHESRADHHHAVQPGGRCVFVFALSRLLYHHTLTQVTILPTDFTEGLPHRPVTRQNPAHLGYNSGEVHAIAVQPPLQDPHPVAHVSVCCYAARRSQLAVPQHHCGAGTGHRRHVGPVNTFTFTFPGAHRITEHLWPLWRSSCTHTRGIWSTSLHFVPLCHGCYWTVGVIRWQRSSGNRLGSLGFKVSLISPSCTWINYLHTVLCG